MSPPLSQDLSFTTFPMQPQYYIVKIFRLQMNLNPLLLLLLLLLINFQLAK